MLDDKFFEKLVKPRKATKNILALDSAGFDDGKTMWAVAPAGLRSLAQNLIEQVDDHCHLQEARILLLVKASESQKAKLQNGQRCVLGKASKANPQTKLLSRIGRALRETADFIVWLNGDWLDIAGATDERGTVCELKGLTDELKQAVALIDHELMHCSAKIVGEFVDSESLDGFVQDLGKRHLETCNDITKPDGKILVRYYAKNKAGGYDFKMRRHDIEEFNGVVGRHGSWSRCLQRLVDVMVESEPTLFAGVK